MFDYRQTTYLDMLHFWRFIYLSVANDPSFFYVSIRLNKNCYFQAEGRIIDLKKVTSSLNESRGIGTSRTRSEVHKFPIVASCSYYLANIYRAGREFLLNSDLRQFNRIIMFRRALFFGEIAESRMRENTRWKCVLWKKPAFNHEIVSLAAFWIRLHNISVRR